MISQEHCEDKRINIDQMLKHYRGTHKEINVESSVWFEQRMLMWPGAIHQMKITPNGR